MVNGKIKYINNMLNSKQISCTELTKKFLSAIDKENKKLNAYVKICSDYALSNAEKVDEKIHNSQKISLLEGVPMALKDNISTKDVETTCCSKILEGYVPIYDAFAWKLLKQQNAILLGKANMDEFAMGSSCETSCFGGAKNPHNIDFVAGGSSGGVASAVGGNIAIYGIGSDTGGSVRQPASFCGLVGLKPTYSAVSRYGLIAYASSFDQIGPIATNVEDVSIIFDAIAKYDVNDSTSSRKANFNTFSHLNDSIRNLKIGVPEEYLQKLNGDIEKSILSAIKVFESLGATVEYFKLPELKFCLPVYYILACAEASSNLARFDGIRYGYSTNSYKDINEMICKTRSEGFGQEVKRRILLGNYVLSSGYYDAYYKKAQKLRQSIVASFNNAFEKFDILLAPTVSTTAFKTGFSALSPVEAYQTDLCTVPVNTVGIPSISIPCGFDSNNLPIGMQLMANRFCEEILLNVAHQFEVATDGVNNRHLDMGVNL